MKTSMTKVSTALALMALSGVAMGASIASTKHNLGGSFNGGGSNGTTKGFNFTTSTTEICVFCHTPHGSDSSAPAPLWNRTLGTSASYQTYSSLGTTTMDATSAGIGSVSLACLSCHDGTQAMNAVINSPGGGSSGDVNKNGTSFISTLSAVDCTDTTGACGGFFEFNYMSQVSAEMIYLSTDLQNDHPISIQFAGAITGGTAARAALDTDFKTAVMTTAAGVSVWYIDNDASGTKTKSDFPLYNRPTGALAGEPLVECATCHDPHTKNTTFLRHTSGNDGSATCLSCHSK